MTGPDLRSVLADLLAFHVEAGVDVALDDAPKNRFAEQNRFAETAEPERSAPPLPDREAPRAFSPVPPVKPRGGSAPAAKAPPLPEAAAADAREAARAATSLEELRAILDAFDGCVLKTTASRLVFADGVPGSRLMLVGEAPGAEEDRQGKPFVGRAGQLLDRMLAAIGLDRSTVYIANIVPWRPPGNRTPTPQESAICLPFITRQIELANPDVLVCLGGFSATTLLGTTDGILKARGRWVTYRTGRRDIRAIATLHPAYLLRQPLQKRLAWRDFLAIRRALAEGPPPS